MTHKAETDAAWAEWATRMRRGCHSGACEHKGNEMTGMKVLDETLDAIAEHVVEAINPPKDAPSEAPTAAPTPAADDETALHMVRVYEAETALGECQRELAERESELDAARANVKAAEGEVDAAVRHLQNVIRGRHQADLPFPAESGAESTVPGPDKDDDSWKADILSEWDFPDALRVKLNSADIRTMGELCAWRSEEVPKKLHGIGAAALQTIDDGIAAYFAKRNAASNTEAAE